MNERHFSARSALRTFFPYGFIFLSVLAFNYNAVFTPAALLHDDPINYYYLMEGRFPWERFKWMLLDPFRCWLQWHVMATSPYLMRTLLVVLFMIPLSASFYYLLRRRFNCTRAVSFAGAVLPNVLPGQWQIPAGINMSYCLPGTLFAVLTLIFGCRYLEKGDRGGMLWLSLSVLFFFMSTQLMEQALLLFPAMIIAFVWNTRRRLPHLKLLIPLCLLSLLRLAQMMIFPRKDPVVASMDQVLERSLRTLQWSTPFPDAGPAAMALLTVGIAAGFILHLLRPAAATGPPCAQLRQVFHLGGVYLFLMAWALVPIVFFILFSNVFWPRYTYITAFGLCPLMMLSLQSLFTVKRPSPPAAALVTVLAGVLVLYSGIQRHNDIADKFEAMNTSCATITTALAGADLPRQSQVVICDIGGMLWGWGWGCSSGQLRYLLQRRDINGLLLPKNRCNGAYSYDDHFDPSMRGYCSRCAMTGLSFSRPVFFYRMDNERRRLVQLAYVLQWKGEDSSAPWVVFQANRTTGSLAPLRAGRGMGEYRQTCRSLARLGITRSDILWGGPPNGHERERLGLR
jgi:xanthosine utilization system XapX-like protein